MSDHQSRYTTYSPRFTTPRHRDNRSSSSLWFALASAISCVNEQIRESECRGFRAK